MKKIKMTIELTYDAEMMHADDEIAKEWFFKDILKNDRLILHSNEIGDEIGNVKVLKIISKDKTKKEIKRCPSPENPCMCTCHENGAKDGTLNGWCYECRMGRHKPLIPKDK